MKFLNPESLTNQDVFLSYIEGAQTKPTSSALRGLLNRDGILRRHLITGDSGLLHMPQLGELFMADDMSGYLEEGIVIPAVRDTCVSENPFRSIYNRSTRLRSANMIYAGVKEPGPARFLDATVSHATSWRYNDLNRNFRKRAHFLLNEEELIESFGLTTIIDQVRTRIETKADAEGEILLSHFYEVADEKDFIEYRNPIREIGDIVYFVNLPDSLGLSLSYLKGHRPSVNFGILQPRYRDSITDDLGKAVDEITLTFHLFDPRVFNKLDFEVVKEIRDEGQGDYLEAYRKYSNAPNNQDWRDFAEAAQVYSESITKILCLSQSGNFKSYVKGKRRIKFMKRVTRGGGVLLTAADLFYPSPETTFLGVLLSFWGRRKLRKLETSIQTLERSSREAVFGEHNLNRASAA